MIDLDPFIINHTLETLRRKNNELREEFIDYVALNNKAVEDMKTALEAQDKKDQEAIATITTLTQMIENLTGVVESLNSEVVQTKLNNIKQEIVTRTLSNMQQYRAHDMFVDTFTTADDIDDGVSIRAEWFADFKAVGRTTAATVYADQSSHPNLILITGNAGDDNGLSQSFILDKNQMIDKVSIYVEKHNVSAWKPILVKISTDLEGVNIVTTGLLNPTDINSAGFYDIKVNNVMLAQYTDYFMSITTEDTYGYRIGVDTGKDTYFPGTSYIRYNNVWTDNNFDIAFKVWCFAAFEDNNATIVTKVHEYEGTLQSIVFDVEAVTTSGSINYYVTIDDGANWKILEPGIETNLLDLAKGNKVRIKAYIDGNSRVDAWGYVIKRGEK